jgi:hypothetical protein
LGLSANEPDRIAWSDKPKAFVLNGSFVGVLTHLVADAAFAGTAAAIPACRLRWFHFDVIRFRLFCRGAMAIAPNRRA